MENEPNHIQEFFAAFPPMFRAYRSQVIALLLAVAVLISCVEGGLFASVANKNIMMTPSDSSEVAPLPSTLDEKFIANIYDRLGITISDTGLYDGFTNYIFSQYHNDDSYVDVCIIETTENEGHSVLCSPHGDASDESFFRFVQNVIIAAGEALGDSSAAANSCTICTAWKLGMDYDKLANDNTMLYKCFIDYDGSGPLLSVTK